MGIPVLAVARLDGSGRVSARPLLQALGWCPGQGVDIDVRHGRLAVTADPRGRYALDPRGLLALPAPLRRLCGLAAGGQVLLAALPAHHLLVVHRADELARLLHPAHQLMVGGHHGR
ncbi:hypothetical protein C8E86_6028 [Catellatospora citrea]|nr:hypothetical protein C8E86_6028 [Catellatospora citrea]